MSPRSEVAFGQLGQTLASLLAVRTSPSQDGATGGMTSHGGPSNVQAPLCSSLQGTQIISLTVRGHGMWPLVMYTAGIWGLDYITEFSPVMRVTALQNTHSWLTRGCSGLGLTRLPGCRKS